MKHESNLTNGYGDGLGGKEPTSNHFDYVEGWLAGAKAKENGEQLPKYFSHHEKHSLPFKRGSLVIVPKGTPFHSMKVGHTFSKKAYIITVFDVSSGHLAYKEYDDVIIKNPSVIWTGAGGYWHETDINNLLEANGL